MSAAKEENMSEDPAIIILESDGKKLQSFVRFLAEFVGPRHSDRELHNEFVVKIFPACVVDMEIFLLLRCCETYTIHKLIL